MRTSFLALALIGAAAAQSGSSNSTAYTTEVVTAYTTYCPVPTTLTTNGKTYTITSATTLTITDCPCTITKTSSPVAPITASSFVPRPSNGTTTRRIVPSGYSSRSSAPYPSTNSTITTAPVAPTGTGAPVSSTTSVAPFKGAASKASAAGAAFLALIGVVAAL